MGHFKTLVRFDITRGIVSIRKITKQPNYLKNTHAVSVQGTFILIILSIIIVIAIITQNICGVADFGTRT